MSNPLFDRFGKQQEQNDPGFMGMLNRLTEFRNQFQGDPQQQVMQMVNSGRVSQAQLNQAQQMATQIQKMLTSMGM